MEKIVFVEVDKTTRFRLQLEEICKDAKLGASRGYIELRLRTVLAQTKWSNLLKALGNVPDDKFVAFVFNCYLCIMGLRAPKTGRGW